MISSRVIFLYFLSVGIVTFIIIVAMNNMLELELIPSEVFSEKIIYFSSVKESNANIKEIFAAMADMEKYPVVIPENYISVKIINQTKNFILTEEQVFEKQIHTTLIVNHTIIPYQQHSIKILEGLSKGSQINLNYTNIENKTRIIVYGEVYLRGSLVLGSFIAEDVINNKIEQTLTSFEKYINNQ